VTGRQDEVDAAAGGRRRRKISGRDSVDDSGCGASRETPDSKLSSSGRWRDRTFGADDVTGIVEGGVGSQIAIVEDAGGSQISDGRLASDDRLGIDGCPGCVGRRRISEAQRLATKAFPRNHRHQCSCCS
jgi:hypothetical protein